MLGENQGDCFENCGCAPHPHDDENTPHHIYPHPMPPNHPPKMVTNLIQQSEEHEASLNASQQKILFLKRYLMIAMFIIVLWTSFFTVMNLMNKRKDLFSDNKQNCEDEDEYEN